MLDLRNCCLMKIDPMRRHVSFYPLLLSFHLQNQIIYRKVGNLQIGVVMLVGKVSQPKHPWCKKVVAKNKKAMLKKMWNQNGNIVAISSNVLQLGHRYQNFNSINSRRPWSPILISHRFQHGLFYSWPQLFLQQGCFGWDFISFLLLIPLFSFLDL